jgi:hypothetical protein
VSPELGRLDGAATAANVWEALRQGDSRSAILEQIQRFLNLVRSSDARTVQLHLLSIFAEVVKLFLHIFEKLRKSQVS